MRQGDNDCEMYLPSDVVLFDFLSISFSVNCHNVRSVSLFYLFIYLDFSLVAELDS